MDESSEMGLVDGLDKFLEENPDAPAIAEAEEAPASQMRILPRNLERFFLEKTRTSDCRL